MLSVLSIQQQLWDRLRESRSLRARGFGCQPTTDHDILIVRNGHVYGVWQSLDHGYYYFCDGHSRATHMTRSTIEALSITLVSIWDK